MSLALFVIEKLNVYLNMSNAIYTILSILIAVIVYFISIIGIGTLKENEIKQLPMGDKIYEFVRKFKKI